MIRVVCAILTIAIKDLEVRLGYSNLLLGKSEIWFKLSVQKRETGKQTVDTLLYYKYQKCVS